MNEEGRSRASLVFFVVICVLVLFLFYQFVDRYSPICHFSDPVTSLDDLEKYDGMDVMGYWDDHDLMSIGTGRHEWVRFDRDVYSAIKINCRDQRGDMVINYIKVKKYLEDRKVELPVEKR